MNNSAKSSKKYELVSDSSDALNLSLQLFESRVVVNKRDNRNNVNDYEYILFILDDAAEIIKLVCEKDDSYNPSHVELKQYVEFRQRITEFEENYYLNYEDKPEFKNYILLPDTSEDCVNEAQDVAPIFIEEEYNDMNPIIWEF